MPSVFKRFSTIIKRDNDKKEKRKSIIPSTGLSKPKQPEPVRSAGKKVVVVSGANLGLGAELVKRFAAEHGTFVIALDSASPSAELKKLFNEDVVSVKLPLSMESKDLAKAIAEVEKLSGGRIDILVNSAAPSKHSAKSISEIVHGDMNNELAAMITTPIAVTNALLPFLKKYTPPPPPPPPAAPEPTTAPAANAEAPSAPAEKETTPSNDAPAEESKATEAPPATADPVPANEKPTEPEPILDSAGNPVSKNDILSQKYLKDENQDPALLPHVEGKVYGSEAKALKESEGEPKFDQREPLPVHDAKEPATTAHVNPPLNTEKADGAATEDVGKANEQTPVANGATVTNGSADAPPANAPPAADAPPAAPPAAEVPVVEAPKQPSFPVNPVVAFLTSSRPSHSTFPPVPFATHTMAHAALHVAITKYAHDLSARGVVVIGVEAGGWDEPDAIHTSTQATDRIIHHLESCTLADNGKVLHHDATPPLLNWSSFKTNTLL